MIDYKNQGKGIDSEKLKRQVDQIKVWEWILGISLDFRHGCSQMFRNPLRGAGNPDRSPSGKIEESRRHHGSLILTDYGDQYGSHLADIFKGVMLAHNIEHFPTALQLVHDNFCNGIAPEPITRVNQEPFMFSKVQHDLDKFRIIPFRRPWENRDTKEWGYYYLSPEKIQSLRVFPIEGYYVNNPRTKRHRNGKHAPEWYTQTKEPAYCLGIHPSGHCKIYRPKLSKRSKNGGSYKWYANTKPEDIFWLFKDMLRNDTPDLIITKSVKDKAVTEETGINAQVIALQNEGVRIPTVIWEMLKDKYPGRWIWMFDNDNGGHRAAKQSFVDYYEDVSIEDFLWMPRVPKTFGDGEMVTDQGDLVRSYGPDSLIDILKENSLTRDLMSHV